MSDHIQPNNFNPIPCDFGPFAGAHCARKLIYNANTQIVGNIELEDINIEIVENILFQVDLKTKVNSVLEIDWNLTEFSQISGGSINFEPITGILTFTPDTTPTTDRTVQFFYTLYDIIGTTKTAQIIINIIDATPSLTVKAVSLSGAETQTFTINTLSHFTITNDTLAGVTISAAPSEGTATIAGNVITFIPSTIPAVNRTITMKYLVTTGSGISKEGTISVALTDTSPAITAKNFSISLKDTETKTFNITPQLTIKNDTFKSVTFATPSEGTFKVTGSSVLYTPNEPIHGDRTIIVQYTATSNTNLTANGILTINIEDDNIWLSTIWYGNSLATTMDKDSTLALASSNRQTTFAGTYKLPLGTGGVYKWIVYPENWGEPVSIYDPNTNFSIALEDPFKFNVDGVPMIGYRTYYPINSDISIKMV